MPSPRSKRPLSARSGSGLWLLALLLVVACAAPVDRPDVAPAPRVRGDAFLVAPTSGYTETLALPAAEALEAGYQSLLRGESPEAVLQGAEGWRQGDALVAATVLAAQAHYVLGECGLAIGRLVPLVEAQQSYLAADLILGRCQEEVGDLPSAAASYQRAEASSAAAARLRDIAPRARDAAVARIEGWLEAGLDDKAQAAIASLQRWAPSDTETLRAVGRLAQRAGDRSLELQTARALTAEAGPEGADRELLARRAELELEVGDAGSGLRILEELVARHPEETELVAQLDRARFAWRLSLLPGPAREVAAEPELDRGELATLIYWVFPSVRYGRPSQAVIANDILDHDHRSEIMRVANLGIMQVDAGLHAFEPDDEALRVDALRGLLRILVLDGDGDRCLDGTTVDARTSFATICNLAARCGLLAEAGECLPQAVLSGAAAMDMVRRVARRLEAD